MVWFVYALHKAYAYCNTYEDVLPVGLIKLPAAISVVNLCLAEGISKLVSLKKVLFVRVLKI